MEVKSTHGILSEHMVFQKTRTTSLNDVRTLNMWGYDLHDVNIIERMQNLEKASLSINKISSLKPFSKCYNLKGLYLRENNISDLNEVCYLSNLQNLNSLMLKDNPIASLPNYRSFIANTLPNLEKLDDIPISSSDRAGINSSRVQVQGNQLFKAGQGILSARGRKNRNEDKRETWQEPNQRFSNDYVIPPKNEHVQINKSNSAEDSMLAAVLALIPELSEQSIQIVLDSIRNRKY